MSHADVPYTSMFTSIHYDFESEDATSGALLVSFVIEEQHRHRQVALHAADGKVTPPGAKHS